MPKRSAFGCSGGGFTFVEVVVDAVLSGAGDAVLLKPLDELLERLPDLGGFDLGLGSEGAFEEWVREVVADIGATVFGVAGLHGDGEATDFLVNRRVRSVSDLGLVVLWP